MAIAGFVARFMGLWRAAADDHTSFYASFAHMSAAEAQAFALSVWQTINRPNWLDHIARAKPAADLVVKKSLYHRLFVA